MRSPLNTTEIVEGVKPDLALLTRIANDLEEGDVPMGHGVRHGHGEGTHEDWRPVLPVSCRVFGNIC